MITLSAAQVAAAVAGELTAQLTPGTPITGPVVIDSREVEPGSLFVALAGERVDGHDFAQAAVTAGAVAVLAQRPVPGVPAIVVPDVQKALGDLAREVLRQLPRTTVVAITGSVGKTTTKDLLAQLLSPLGETIAPRGSFNNEIGMPLTVLQARPETRFLVLEMGASGVGHLDYLTSIAVPSISVVLAVGRAHVGEFGGIEAVARAKSELVRGTAPGGTVVLNADDERVAAMGADAVQRRVITFGVAGEVSAQNVELSSNATAHFDLVTAGGSARVALQLVGAHQVSNALAAASVALELGSDVEAVANGLSRARALSYGRMAVTNRSDGVRVINDAYNANPDSMSAALASLAQLGSGGRTWAVLGEMRELGADSAAGHFEVGRRAVELGIDRLLVVGEEASEIARGAEAQNAEPRPAQREASRVEVVADTQEASIVLRQHLRAGDVVLVKASNGAGLWRLGDELTLNAHQEED